MIQPKPKIITQVNMPRITQFRHLPGIHVYITYTLHIHYIYITYRLRIHYIHIAYILHIHYIRINIHYTNIKTPHRTVYTTRFTQNAPYTQTNSTHTSNTPRVTLPDPVHSQLRSKLYLICHTQNTPHSLHPKYTHAIPSLSLLPLSLSNFPFLPHPSPSLSPWWQRGQRALQHLGRGVGALADRLGDIFQL
jgi:hypothetical protein